MSLRVILPRVVAGLMLIPGIVLGQGTATVSIQADQAGATVSSNLFGVFFEEINFGGDGGLYGEMVRNRSFAQSATPDYWTLTTNGTATGAFSVDTSLPLNTNNLASLNLTMASGTGSINAVNSGYWGMSVQSGATYLLNFYARASAGFAGPVQVRLQNSSGSTVYAQTTVSGLTAGWQRFSVSLISSTTDTNAQLSLGISTPATVWLDMVSLFPKATFNNRTNGLRLDIANMVQVLGASFLRYPGGNFIEANNLTNAVRWKNTIGDVAQRPGHQNDAWGYWSTDGYGLDEAFGECQDMGMQMLYGINAGLSLGYNGSTNNTVPLSQMGPWVQDALDLIQYANGDTSTTWGALRAANGHPAPYNMQYMEIGNENGGSYYNDRYALFYSAIKSNYPSMHLIVPDWGGIPTATPVEIQDEHYYSSPATFISYATKYDSYSRSGPKVFVGEYAVTSGYGTYGNLSAALGEAAFMSGMERNSDLVQMASYAPLFANVNGTQWHPDLIYYNNSQVFGTPSYYVQQMFSRNRGDYILPVSVTASNTSSYTPHGTIGVGSWNTAVQYTNIVVTSNGVPLYQSDFVNQGTSGWNVFNGTWSAASGLYQQTAQITDCYSAYTNNASTNWANYTITLQARKTGGSEGFLIMFNLLDNNNWTWWNIGGWNNTLDGIEQMVGGSKTTYAQVSQTITQNTWYYIRIVVTGARAQCYLGTNATQVATNLVQDVTLPNSQAGLLASTTYSKSSGQVVIKAVNPYAVPLATTFNLAGVATIAPSATVIQLTSGSATDENSFAAPAYVSPVTNSISNAGTNFSLTLPANSLSIIRLTASGIDNCSNLSLQLPAVITNGVSVSSVVLAQKDGSWVDLTANTNHALVWTSANTSVATVDRSGNVVGLAPGTTSIIVSYPALGLSATQTVQVVYVPTVLVHRYSFSDVSGSLTAADSIGGLAWNGTLPNGGTFGSGQLQLAAASSQYLQLPAGIVSNYPAVTIELWATFPGTLPSACFLFGFGNISGSSGYNYIFCQPKNGRIAITPSNYSGEQNTAPDPSADWSSQTNLHVTAVFNPPQGTLALYTNGVLAAVNNAVTVPMSSVNDLYSYVGRSLYSADAYFNCSLDEFRIYNGALSAVDVAATDVLGPDAVLSTNAPVVSPVVSGGSLTLSWPVASSGFNVYSTTNLAAGNWSAVAVTPQIVGARWQASIPVASGQQFYRLGR